MAPNIYYSSKTEALTALLLEEIKQEKTSQKNPFQQTYILIPNSGMQRHLEIQIANQLGVSAQISIIYPAQFLWQCYQLLIEDISQLKPIDQRKVTFELIQLFEQHQLTPLFDSSLNHWLKTYSTAEQRFQFAHQLAKLFNQYINQRPNWIEKWANHQTIFEHTHDEEIEQWQAQLFKALKLTQYARSHLQKKFHRRLNQSRKTPLTEQLNAKSIHLFGFNHFPQSRLDDFIALSSLFSIHFYLINPSVHYWQDIVPSHIKEKIELTTEDEQSFIEVGHPLLASWGQAGKSLISELEPFNPINIDESLSFPVNHLLQWLQKDIIYFDDLDSAPSKDIRLAIQKETENTSLKASNSPISSISIHSTTHPKREVEILYETLCKLLDNDPTLNPNDMIVMLPSLSEYTSHIQSVFPAYGHTNHIPYSIADQSSLEHHGEVEFFLNILSLINHQFKVKTLLDCLNHQIAKAHYQLSEKQLESIKQWLIESRFTQHFDDRSQGQQSSIEKLQNMLLLAAIGESENNVKNQDQLTVNADFYHFNQSDTLIKLSQFIRDIKPFASLKTEQHELPEWHQILFKIAQTFIDKEGVVHRLLTEWGEIFSQPSKVFNHSNSPAATYDFQTILCDWETHLSQEKLYGPFLSGGVSFCTTLPMRVIPTRFIAILGLNQDIPHIDKKHPLDLMQKSPRWSDMVNHKSFKYLFLETLLSARDFFYLSYCGQNLQTLEKQPPSILIEELLSYLKSKEKHLSIDAQSLVYDHYPIQSFLTDSESDLSYLSIYHSDPKTVISHQLREEKAKESKDNQKENHQVKSCSIHQWVNFLTHPLIAYLQYSLEVKPFEVEKLNSLAEDDVLNTQEDGLLSWQYTECLLRNQLHHSHQSIEKIKAITTQQLQQANRAAPNALLSAILDKKNEQLLPIIAAFKQLNSTFQSITEYVELINLNTEINGAATSCLLHSDQYYQNNQQQGLFDYKLSELKKMKVKNIFTLWVQHLLLTVHQKQTKASTTAKPQQPVVSQLACYNGVIEYLDISHKEAHQLLKTLFEWVEKLNKQPLLAELSMVISKKAPHFKLDYLPIENKHYPSINSIAISENAAAIQWVKESMESLLNQNLTLI